MKRVTTTLAVCAFTAAAFTVTTVQPSWAKTPGNTLVIADQIDDIQNLDPAEVFEFSGTIITRNVYDKLVAFDPNNLGPLQPGLAASWEVGADGKTYTFKMRQGIKFHSGNPVTAADAEFSLQRAVILKKTPSFILTQFGFTADNVKDTIKATSADTLVITVNKPYAPTFFLNCLTASIGAIVDKKLVMSHAKDGDLGYGWLKTNSAGSGAYKLKSWKPNESYTLEKVQDYWRGNVAMKKVVVRHIAESANQRLLLEKGDVDVSRSLSPEDVAAINGKNGLVVNDDLKGRIMYIALNQKNKTLSNPKVIEAMKYLIDYKGMAGSFLRGQYVVHQAFLPLTYMGELKEQPYKLDIAKAKALLAEAGYPTGFNVDINVRTRQDRLEIAQTLQSNMAKVGIKANLVTGTGKQVLTVYRARKHGIYLGAWGPDYPDPHTNADTFSHNPDNSDAAKLTGKLAWRNSWNPGQMTADTAAAVLERDGAKRAKMYRAIQREHQKSSPFGIMFQHIKQNAMRDNVKGFIGGGAITETYYWTVTK